MSSRNNLKRETESAASDIYMTRKRGNKKALATLCLFSFFLDMRQNFIKFLIERIISTIN